jgi:hypothetical protein
LKKQIGYFFLYFVQVFFVEVKLKSLEDIGHHLLKSKIKQKVIIKKLKRLTKKKAVRDDNEKRIEEFLLNPTDYLFLNNEDFKNGYVSLHKKILEEEDVDINEKYLIPKIFEKDKDRIVITTPKIPITTQNSKNTDSTITVNSNFSKIAINLMKENFLDIFQKKYQESFLSLKKKYDKEKKDIAFEKIKNCLKGEGLWDYVTFNSYFDIYLKEKLRKTNIDFSFLKEIIVNNNKNMVQYLFSFFQEKYNLTWQQLEETLVKLIVNVDKDDTDETVDKDDTDETVDKDDTDETYYSNLVSIIISSDFVKAVEMFLKMSNENYMFYSNNKGNFQTTEERYLKFCLKKNIKETNIPYHEDNKDLFWKLINNNFRFSSVFSCKIINSTLIKLNDLLQNQIENFKKIFYTFYSEEFEYEVLTFCKKNKNYDVIQFILNGTLITKYKIENIESWSILVKDLLDNEKYDLLKIIFKKVDNSNVCCNSKVFTEKKNYNNEDYTPSLFEIVVRKFFEEKNIEKKKELLEIIDFGLKKKVKIVLDEDEQKTKKQFERNNCIWYDSLLSQSHQNKNYKVISKFISYDYGNVSEKFFKYIRQEILMVSLDFNENREIDSRDGYEVHIDKLQNFEKNEKYGLLKNLFSDSNYFFCIEDHAKQQKDKCYKLNPGAYLCFKYFDKKYLEKNFFNKYEYTNKNLENKEKDEYVITHYPPKICMLSSPASDYSGITNEWLGKMSSLFYREEVFNKNGFMKNESVYEYISQEENKILYQKACFAIGNLLAKSFCYSKMKFALPLNGLVYLFMVGALPDASIYSSKDVDDFKTKTIESDFSVLEKTKIYKEIFSFYGKNIDGIKFCIEAINWEEENIYENKKKVEEFLKFLYTKEDLKFQTLNKCNNHKELFDLIIGELADFFIARDLLHSLQKGFYSALPEARDKEKLKNLFIDFREGIDCIWISKISRENIEINVLFNKKVDIGESHYKNYSIKNDVVEHTKNSIEDFIRECKEEDLKILLKAISSTEFVNTKTKLTFIYNNSSSVFHTCFNKCDLLWPQVKKLYYKKVIDAPAGEGKDRAIENFKKEFNKYLLDQAKAAIEVEFDAL